MRNRPYPVLKCSRESVRTTVGIASSTNKLPLYHSTTTRTPKPFPSQRLTTPSATARRTRTITRTGTSSNTGTDDTNRPCAPVGRLLAFGAATLEAEPRLGAETAAARITPFPVCPLALRAALALCGQAGSARTLQTGRLPPRTRHAAKPARAAPTPRRPGWPLYATRAAHRPAIGHLPPAPSEPIACGNTRPD